MKVKPINRTVLSKEMTSSRNKVEDVLDDIPSNAAICVYLARLEEKLNELIEAHNALVEALASHNHGIGREANGNVKIVTEPFDRKLSNYGE